MPAGLPTVVRLSGIPSVVERDRRFPVARHFTADTALVVAGGVVVAGSISDAGRYEAIGLQLVDEVGELLALRFVIRTRRSNQIRTIGP